MFDWLTDLVSGSPITYLVVFGAAAGDVLFPVIPSETIVITASVLAAQGELAVWLIALAAAVGAFVGDNISYALGRTVGDPVAERLFRGQKGRRRLEWAERAIRDHGVLLILVGRFIPGGRTASTFASGTLELPWRRRFVPADAAAAVVWAVYSTALGYLGGSAFKDSLWKSLAASLGAAAVVALGVEVWRRVQKRRGKDVLGA
ncbi:MAG TPA: DedA family protein [Solirubrobacteraceae bacterium]|nr:DedA family protein [Solirubrobacteraceae bacterium]